MSDEKPTESNETPATSEATEATAASSSEKVSAAPKPELIGGVGDWAFLAVVSIATAGIDLWTKAWALSRLSRAIPNPPPLCAPPPGRPNIDYLMQRQPSDTVTLIRDYLDLTYAENCGGAWGLLHGASEAIRRPFFLLVTFGAIAFIVHLYRTMEPGQRLMKWALPLVLGGAIGNLVDRVRLGYVVDFIHMHVKLRFHWPTYNVADIAISVGIGLMVLEYIIGPKKAPSTVAPSPVATTP